MSHGKYCMLCSHKTSNAFVWPQVNAQPGSLKDAAAARTCNCFNQGSLCLAQGMCEGVPTLRSAAPARHQPRLSYRWSMEM